MIFPLAHFERFVQASEVPSKDRGWTSAWPLFGGQRYGLKEIARGLEEGIHNFLILSARQVGKTTCFVDLLGLYWPQRYHGITGIMVSDNDENRDYRRDVHGQMIARLSDKWRFPARIDNLHVRAWDGVGSRLMYEAVGSKFNKSFGRSRGINFLVADEVGAWQHQRAVQALNAALSENHPNRLYVWNTTAQGHDIFKTMWKEAEDSPVTRQIFLGWYLDERLQVSQDNRAIWDRYGTDRLTEDERTAKAQVKARYDVDLTPEQMVWYRSILDTKFYGDEDMRAQEYPNLPEDAFVSFGDKFFRPALIRALLSRLGDAPTPSSYRYEFGRSLEMSAVNQVETDGELTVWEQPKADGVYIVSCHPAYSSSPTAGDDVIQVWRAYPDQLVQAAEYVLKGGGLTAHCAWVCIHLGGDYRMNRRTSDIYQVMDMEMTGLAVYQEMDRIERRGWSFARRLPQGQRELQDFMGAVRHYYFRRPDATGSGVVLEWKSQASFRPWMLNQLRDSLENRQIEIRSEALLDELAGIRRGEVDRDVIAAAMGEELSECRVLAMAMATEQWLSTVVPEIEGLFPPRQESDSHRHVGEVLVGNWLHRVRTTGRAR